MLQGRRGTLVGLGKSIPCTFPFLGIAVCKCYVHLHFSFKGSVVSALFHCAMKSVTLGAAEKHLSLAMGSKEGPALFFARGGGHFWAQRGYGRNLLAVLFCQSPASSRVLAPCLSSSLQQCAGSRICPFHRKANSCACMLVKTTNNNIAEKQNLKNKSVCFE